MKNERIYKLELTRAEICDLKLACTFTGIAYDENKNTKWSKLHDKLKEQLDLLDDEYEAPF